MEAVVVQHVPYEGPGMIRPALQAWGIDSHVVRTWQGDPLPPVADIAALVVLGGPMGVGDYRGHPHLLAERRLVSTCVDADVPVLGICLGAQMLASVLGARVHRGLLPELGFGRVDLTPDGMADPIVGTAAGYLPVMHWHEDTFALPRGATLLASSGTYANQAFRYGPSYGLQFHLELDGWALAQVCPHLPPGVRLDPVAMDRTVAVGEVVLGRWAEHVRMLMGRRDRVLITADWVAPDTVSSPPAAPGRTTR